MPPRHAIAGLLSRNSAGNNSGLAGLGEIPVLGTLFRSDRFQRAESELVIIVTPFIVRPSSERLATPADGVRVSNDMERLFDGQAVRNNQPRGSRGPVNTDGTLDQWFLRQVVQLVDGVPRRLVAHARAFRRTGDRALLGNVLQQRNALRATNDVLGERGRQGHGGHAFRREVAQKVPATLAQVKRYPAWAYAPGNTRRPAAHPLGVAGWPRPAPSRPW